MAMGKLVDHTDDRLIRKGEVLSLLGGVSHMHLKRILANPASGFPQPYYQNKFPCWWRNDVVRWINGLPTQPRARAPNNFAKGKRRKTAQPGAV
jgi:hypothetical protein